MECPICDAPARIVRAPAFDGRRIECRRCGTFDISRVVLERQLLERIDKAMRREILNRARSAAPERSRPIITTYLM
jgi:hypothetical protein